MTTKNSILVVDGIQPNIEAAVSAFETNELYAMEQSNKTILFAANIHDAMEIVRRKASSILHVFTASNLPLMGKHPESDEIHERHRNCVCGHGEPPTNIRPASIEAIQAYFNDLPLFNKAANVHSSLINTSIEAMLETDLVRLTSTFRQEITVALAALEKSIQFPDNFLPETIRAKVAMRMANVLPLHFTCTENEIPLTVVCNKSIRPNKKHKNPDIATILTLVASGLLALEQLESLILNYESTIPRKIGSSIRIVSNTLKSVRDWKSILS